MKTKIVFKKSLTFDDLFYVASKLSRVSRFKFVFEQKIFLHGKSDMIVTESNNLIC